MGSIVYSGHYVSVYGHVYGGNHWPNVVYSQYGADMGRLYGKLMCQKKFRQEQPSLVDDTLINCRLSAV